MQTRKTNAHLTLLAIAHFIQYLQTGGKCTRYLLTDASDFTRIQWCRLSLAQKEESSPWPGLATTTVSTCSCEEPSTLLWPQLWVGALSVSPVGVQQADEEEMRLMASTPYSSHIYSVATFDMIKNVQRKLIGRMCAGVEDQINAFISGDERKTSFMPCLSCRSPFF